MSLWSKLFGVPAGIAVGGAAAGAVEPVMEGIRQDAWAQNAIKVVQAEAAAQAVAQYLMTPGDAHAEGAAEGFSATRMDYLISLARTAPDMGTATELLRREFINSGNFDHARKKAGIEDEWLEPLSKLVDSILSPADLANAVQQGFIDEAGLLPGLVGGNPPFNIPVETVGIPTLDEFKHSGYDPDRAKVLAELVGLPPGPGELLQMLNRGIITDGSYYVGIREGHTKTKWADALKELRYAIISPIEAANLRLRGWIDDTEMYRLGSISGAREETQHYLYLMQGRPPGPGQLQTAYNRGLIDRPTFDKGIQESDVRPEWTDTLFGLRARYPTPFALRQLGTSGTLTAAEITSILELEGYPDWLASKMGVAFASGKTAKQKDLAQGTIETLYESRYIDATQATALLTKLGYTADEITLILELGDARRVKKFLDAAVSRIHTKFVENKTTEAAATQALNDLNISTQAIDDLLATWKLEREVNLPTLTPAQFAAAAYYGVLTNAQALSGIEALGYSPKDAIILLDIRLHNPVIPVP
jgi:hypothetical protein